MKFLPFRVLVLFVAWSVIGVTAIAQEQSVPPTRRDEQAKVRQFRETAISPDGKRVAWVEDVDDEAGHPITADEVWDFCAHGLAA